MTGAEIAGFVAAACLLVVTAFQIGLASGAPWGRAAFGGQHPGRLPTNLRVVSAVAAVVWPLVAFVVLRQAGWDVWSPVPEGALSTVTWVVAGFLGLSVLLNGASRSPLERNLWTPLCLVACAATMVVALA